MRPLRARLYARLADADRRLDRRLSADTPRRGDAGFVLLETVISIGLISVIMAAFTTFFVNAVETTSQQRARQSAIQIANSEVEAIRGLRASDLVTGHDAQSVQAQTAAAPSTVTPWLQSMEPAIDAGATFPAGRSANPPTQPSEFPETLNNVPYTINTYLGWCEIPADAAKADCAIPGKISGIRYLRAVVAVSWPAQGCPDATCTYLTATLLNAADDPTFNLNQRGPTAPVIVRPGDRVSTVGDPVVLQLSTESGTGVPDFDWVVTGGALPEGLALTRSGLISGIPAKASAATPVEVTVTDGFGRMATTSFTWTVRGKPSVTAPADQISTTGAVVSAQLVTTCPNSPCTYLLVNGPAGLSISSTGLVTGTVTSAPRTFAAASVTVTDAEGVSTSSAAFSWIVAATPTVTSPGNQSTPVGTQVSLTLTSACPKSPCSYALVNGPATLTISSTGVITGTITSPPSTFAAVTVAVTSADGVTASSPAFSWTVTSPPTLVTPANQASTISAVISLQLTTACPNAPCSYALNNGPAGLSISSSGLITGTITGTAQVFAAVTITVTGNSGITTTSTAFSWTIYAKPTVSTPAARTGSTGGTVSQALTKSCPNLPCTYQLVNGPAGVTINATGVITGTITSAPQIFSTARVTITDASGVSATSANFVWTVVAGPTVTAPSNKISTVGSVVSVPVASVCPYGPCTYVLNNKPATLVISTTGVITGTITSTPQTFAAVSVKITAKDAATSTSTTFSWTVVAKPTVTAPTERTSTTGGAVSLQLATTCPNSPCSYALNGGPAGLSINAAGLVTGTVTSTPQTFVGASVTVTDNSAVAVTSSVFNWNVVAAPTVTAPVDQTGSVGRTVSVQLVSTCPNSPCTYLLVNGPAGLSINSSGLLSGTLAGPAQIFANARISITDASGVSTLSTAFTWTVLAGPSVAAPPDQTSTSGTAVSLQLTTTCANSPCGYVLNNGPAGLGIDAAGLVTGTITSAPQTFANVSVTITDADGVRSTSSAFTWAVVAKPGVTTPANQTNTTGAAVSVQLVASCPNSPCTYLLNNGPAGLSINAAGLVTGTITSSPQSLTLVTFTVTDADNAATTSTAFVWNVLAKPTVSAPANQSSTLGTATSLQLATTCPNAPCSYTLNNGPAGLAINTSGLITGTITGTPQTFSNVTVSVTDADGVSALSTPFSWTVLAQPSVIAPGDQTSTTGAAVSLPIASTCANGPCSYALNNGPAGLGITGGGVITGSITSTPQTFTAVTITITDSSGATATSASFSWTVVARPTVTAPANQLGSTGGTVSLQLAGTCANAPCSYALTNGPAGLSINAAGRITGTITSTPQNFTAVTVTVTDNSGATATSAAFTWTVVAKPTITTPANRTNTTGAAISLQLATTCPNAPCSYTLNNGPAGLSISTAGLVTGTITSTPQTFTAVTITATAKDGAATTSTQFSWTIVAKPTITTPTNRTNTTGAAISLQLATTCANAPCSYTLNNGPAGLTVNAAGLITGTITSTPQTFNAVTITATDANNVATTSTQFSWTIVAKPTITAPTNRTSTTGAAISLQLATTCANSPCSYVLNNGPAGLSISSTGLITGTITSAAGLFGAVTITATDANGVAATSTAFTWTVLAKAGVAAPANQTGTTGSTVSLQLATNCPNGPCTYLLINGPAGLSISSTGLISGTITSSPQIFSNVSISVTDASGVSAVSSVFSWTVLAQPGVTAPNDQISTTGAAVSLALSTTCANGPCSYALNNGPAGLSITAGGVITGTITSPPQSFPAVTVTVTDNSGVAATTASFSWTVVTRPTVTAPANQTSTSGAPVSLQLASTCANAPCSYSLNNGPAGLSIDAAGLVTGTITSTPQNFAAVTVTVTDNSGVAASSATFGWTVVARPTVTAPANRTNTTGAAISLQLATTCANAPCSYNLNNGPAGLSINAAGLITGTITSTPQTFGSVSVSVTDAGGVSAVSSVFSWTVQSKPTVTAPPSRTSTTGAAISLQLATTCANSPCSYTLNNGPAGLSITAAGVITGTITSTPQSFTAVTVTVTDNSGVTATSAAFTWSVVAKPTATTPANRTSTTSAAISLQVVTTCPNAPCSYVVNNGPAGLSINATGLITGTITSTPQTFNAVTITVTDNSGVAVNSTQFSWSIVAKPSVTAPANQSTTSGTAVSLQLATTCPNSPCTYLLINGPAGLSISSTGLITGTITSTPQTFSNASVSVTDAGGVSAVSSVFSWTINPALSVTAPPNQTSTTGSMVSLALASACSSAPCTYALNNGPAGLSITTGGVITGTITSTPQTFAAVTVTIRSSTGALATSAAFTWTVSPAPTVTSPGRLVTTLGATISLQLATTCPNSPCSYVLNNGPATLSIDASGLVTGTITSAPRMFATVTVTVTDRSGFTATSGVFEWTVQPKPSVTAPASQTTAKGAVVGLALVISCPNWPCSYVLNNGPAGLSINSSGFISGTVTSSPQVFTPTVTVTDASGVSTTSAAFSWTVTYAPLAATNPGAQKSTVNAPIDPVQMTAGGGSGNYAWSVVSGLPTGLSLTTNGLITGTPTVAIPSTVTLRVTDTTTALSTTVQFTWTVVARPTVGALGSQTGTAGTTKSVPLAYTCPYAVCTFTLSGTVPGLGLSTTATNSANNTTTTLSVAAVSGTVYVNGTIQHTAVPAGASANYAPTITITDGADASTTPAAGAWTIWAAPTLGQPYANFTATEGAVKSVPLPYTCPYVSCTITLTGAVPGLGLSTDPANTANNVTTTLVVASGSGTVYINGTIQATAVTIGSSRNYTIAVRIADASGAGPQYPPAAVTWTIYQPPTIAGPGNLSATEGSVEQVALPYTCPYISCTVVLTGAVPGLGLSSTAGSTGNNTTTTLSVASASGTLYINGTVQMTAVTTGTSRVYNPGVRIIDGGGFATPTITGTWTIYTPPTITAPGDQAVEPNQTVSLQIAALCPNGGCTYAAAAQVNGTPDWNPIPISATGLISYPSAPAGDYTVRVIVTDREGVTATTTFGLSVEFFALNLPNLTSVRPTFGTRTVTFDLKPYMSPNVAGLIYTGSNLPPWLTVSSDGILTAQLTNTTTSSYNIGITVRSKASSTSTALDTFSWTITS